MQHQAEEAASKQTWDLPEDEEIGARVHSDRLADNLYKSSYYNIQVLQQIPSGAEVASSWEVPCEGKTLAPCIQDNPRDSLEMAACCYFHGMPHVDKGEEELVESSTCPLLAFQRA